MKLPLILIFSVVILNTAAAQPTSKLQSAPQFTPASAEERVDERLRMVERQIARPVDGRTPVKDQRVLRAMRLVPRHRFMPRFSGGLPVRAAAYSDSPLPIGSGQTISQPYIVALMTELLAIKPGSKVLEVGTGSGYQAAVLAHITGDVFSIEIIESLAKRAAKTLREENYTSIKLKHGDGFHGWEEHAPYDAIIITFAPTTLPAKLWQQLKPGGRIVVPLGEPHGLQQLKVISKGLDNSRSERVITAVRFVPMLRKK